MKKGAQSTGVETKAKGNWRVEVDCVVRKVIYAENCTEAQARYGPWKYSVSEIDGGIRSWEVKSVKSNE